MTANVTLSAADIVQGQLDAYNAQDLEALCGFFANDVVLSDLNGSVTLQGLEAYRTKYAQLFADHPQNHALLVNRISVGQVVIDHERVARAQDAQSFETVVIYTLARGKIARVDFVK